jgi:hypothetical protein
MSSCRRPEGIVVRHSTRCASREGERCDCRPGYQAQVFSARDQRTIRKTFKTLSDARAWQHLFPGAEDEARELLAQYLDAHGG